MGPVGVESAPDSCEEWNAPRPGLLLMRSQKGMRLEWTGPERTGLGAPLRKAWQTFEDVRYDAFSLFTEGKS